MEGRNERREERGREKVCWKRNCVKRGEKCNSIKGKRDNTEQKVRDNDWEQVDVRVNDLRSSLRRVITSGKSAT